MEGKDQWFSPTLEWAGLNHGCVDPEASQPAFGPEKHLSITTDSVSGRFLRFHVGLAVSTLLLTSPARLPAPGHPSPLPEEPSVPATALTLLGCSLGLGLQCGQIGQEALKWGRGTERAGRSGSKTRSHIETSALCAQTGPESGPLPCISAAQAGWD